MPSAHTWKASLKTGCPSPPIRNSLSILLRKSFGFQFRPSGRSAARAQTSRPVLRALEGAGFYIHHVSGSHYILKHPNNATLRVTVPFHNRDLKRRTLESIVKQAGLSREEFLRCL